jgi:heme-degrading monooxygenase HmoA
VVVRLWRGWTKAEDAEAYTKYIEETGVQGLSGTPGNQGVQMWLRADGDLAEFVVMSLWDSRDSIKAFAGDNIEVARFYPEDERYLVERDLTVTHYDVVASA